MLCEYNGEWRNKIAKYGHEVTSYDQAPFIGLSGVQYKHLNVNHVQCNIEEMHSSYWQKYDMVIGLLPSNYISYYSARFFLRKDKYNGWKMKVLDKKKYAKAMRQCMLHKKILNCGCEKVLLIDPYIHGFLFTTVIAPRNNREGIWRRRVFENNIGTVRYGNSMQLTGKGLRIFYIPQFRKKLILRRTNAIKNNKRGNNLAEKSHKFNNELKVKGRMSKVKYKWQRRQVCSDFFIENVIRFYFDETYFTKHKRKRRKRTALTRKEKARIKRFNKNKERYEKAKQERLKDPANLGRSEKRKAYWAEVRKAKELGLPIPRGRGTGGGRTTEFPDEKIRWPIRWAAHVASREAGRIKWEEELKLDEEKRLAKKKRAEERAEKRRLEEERIKAETELESEQILKDEKEITDGNEISS